jgi:hypothetical protein
MTHFLDAGLFDPTCKPEPEQHILEGLICRGDLAVWIGREKHRKSNVTLQTAICAALGRPFLHFKHGTGQPMRVVIFDYESKNPSFHKRYEAICRSMGLSEGEKATLRTHLRVILVRELCKKSVKVPRFPARIPNDDHEDVKWWKQFAQEYPADLYIFDPMRCLHAQDENDSTIEALLSKLRAIFPNAAIVVPHHMNRSSASGKDFGGFAITLSQPDSLRAFANGCRGSTAINAHADVVICQERRIESDVETVYLAAYMKDAADVEPLPLVESDHESFYWIVSRKVPEKLRASYEALRKAGRSFKNEAEAVTFLRSGQNGHGVARATAYRHVKDMRDGGFLVTDANGNLVLGECSSEI